MGISKSTSSEGRVRALALQRKTKRGKTRDMFTVHHAGVIKSRSRSENSAKPIPRRRKMISSGLVKDTEDVDPDLDLEEKTGIGQRAKAQTGEQRTESSR